MHIPDENKLADEIERDAADPEAWETDVPRGDKKRLGAQVTVRLDPDDAERLRRIAAAKRVGYTSLVRAWIIERLAIEDMRISMSPPRVQYAATVVSGGSTTLTTTGLRNIVPTPV